MAGGFDFATAAELVTWMEDLSKRWTALEQENAKILDEVGDVFGSPSALRERYIPPDCQQVNPADTDNPAADLRRPAFDMLAQYLSAEPRFEGGNHVFILADAGMGKTSLLVMQWLWHLDARKNPGAPEMALLKLGEDTLERVEAMEGKNRTVLLLDSLDEDPLAWRKGPDESPAERLEKRLEEILRATDPFRAVIITCRTQFFPKGGEKPYEHSGRIQIAGRLCPVWYLSPFSDPQVTAYIEKAYPLTTRQKMLRERPMLQRFWSWMGWEDEEPPTQDQAHALMEKVGDVRCRPMVLAHLDALITGEVTVQGDYALYDTIVTEWLLREEKKNGLECKALRRACHTIAMHMYRRGPRRTISMRELYELVPQMAPELDEVVLSGRSLLNKRTDGDFRFAHFSIHEFMVVQAVLSSAPFRPGRRFHVTDQMRRFIASAPHRTISLGPGRVLWPGCVLWRADLREAGLRGADLGGAHLVGADLRGVDLREANLRWADLRGADLREADLRGADLRGADLREADLRGADLRGADLREADLRGAVVTAEQLATARVSPK